VKVENEVHPDPEAVKAFLAGAAEPVVMVNLLEFRDRAVYADGRETSLTGREAYGLYARAMRKLVEAAGGRFLWAGEVESLLLGRVEKLWDTVALVEYPTPGALVQIAASPEFREIEQHREAGLAGQLNLAARATAIAE
jgi:uncharacterized protein (DUF1330 family)